MTCINGMTDHMRTEWERDGVFVVESVVPAECLARLRDEIWSFLEMSPDEADSWYDKTIRAQVGIDDRGMIPVYHSP